MVELVMVKLHTFTQCFLSHVGPTSSVKVLPEKLSLTFYFLGIILSFFWFLAFWPSVFPTDIPEADQYSPFVQILGKSSEVQHLL